MDYEAVIGLETHAELMTQSKMFCGCAVVDSVSAPPNTAVCEVCAGLPGTLPVVNARAVEFALRVAVALNCEIQPLSVFARKNYFYPDLPKGYQISQYELPLALRGWIDIDTAAGPRRVRIRRVHLEEDTGKLTHSEDGGRKTETDASARPTPSSLVDLNRAGVPLLEIVTEPDLHTPEEVKAYAVALRSLLRYLGVNSGDMEKGILRFEPNISVRPVGSAELRTRTELKNLNSFRVLERGTAYEIERQIAVWDSGGEVLQETRGWNEARNETVGQRGKEHAHDYRYFPEPDLPPLQLTPDDIARVRASLPELPAAKRERFIRDYGLSPYDAGVLVAEQAVAAYFEEAVQATEDGGRKTDKAPSSVLLPPLPAAKPLANWITGELYRLMNRDGVEIGAVKVSPRALAGLHALVAAGTINTGTAKAVLEEMFAGGQDAQAIVAARGLGQISDTGAIEALIDEVLASNPEQVRTYLGGKASVEQWFFGQVMKGLKGRGNPAVIRQALVAKLQHLGETRNA
jgi:aspartyl-tRNA(Asn)/glutamyl-tRNA(Gln) amidotransferase subunit B